MFRTTCGVDCALRKISIGCVRHIKSGMVIQVASSMIVMEVTIYYYELTDVENTFHESGFSKEVIRVRTVAIIKE